MSIHRIGFTELTGIDSARNGPCRVNIVFVHGLRGHPRHTWEDSRNVSSQGTGAATSSKRKFKSFFKTKSSTSTADNRTSEDRSAKLFWPDEYLTQDIPEARVWTYGYNADVISGMFQANNQNSVSQHGRDFAAKIDREIENEDPILFVAHSLGGIIVKDAIRRSTEKFRERTKLIVFLGTPHRGSSYAEWGEIAVNLASLALQDSNKKIVRTLDVNSEVLENIHEEFTTIVYDFGIKIHSFQEARGISGMKGLHNMVVSTFASKLDLPKTFETVESIDANHIEMARCTDRADPRYRAIVGVLKHFVHSMAVDRDRTRPQEMLSTLSGIRTQPQNALATTGQSDGQAGQPGTTSRAYTQHSDSCPQASMRPLTIVGSWLAQPHIQQADSRNLPTRNRGIATAGNYAVVLDSQNQAWRTDISNTPNTWSAYPSVIGGIDMIAVGGDIFNFNTEWRLVALSKSYSSQYYWRQLSDLTSSWIPGNNDFDRNDFDRNDFDRNDFANTPPNLKSISCGGLDPIFVFGVLSDGNYSVTQFPNGGWWKNWHANMGPQKPTLTQMVTCNFKNYGLDASGSVFSQTLWQRSGQAVSQWHQCPAPGNQGVTLLAASKTFVFAFAIDSSLWKMDSTSGTEAWTSIPQSNPGIGLTPVAFAASDSTVVIGSADGSISVFNLSTTLGNQPQENLSYTYKLLNRAVDKNGPDSDYLAHARVYEIIRDRQTVQENKNSDYRTKSRFETEI